jgi:hypothetical protein
MAVQGACLLLLSLLAFFVRSTSQGHSFANQFDPTSLLACLEGQPTENTCRSSRHFCR